MNNVASDFNRIVSDFEKSIQNLIEDGNVHIIVNIKSPNNEYSLPILKRYWKENNDDWGDYAIYGKWLTFKIFIE